MSEIKNEEKPQAAKFNSDEMHHIIRLFNTNIDGTKKITFSLTKIRGIGLRFAKAIVLRAGINPHKFAGEMTQEEINKIQEVIGEPIKNGIPEYFLNHQKDNVTGESTQLVGIKLDGDLRMYIEKGKKYKHVRACRLAVGLKCNGQRTCSNGRRKKSAVSGSKKKK